MKKTTLFLGVLFAGATLFTSCNKDLKNDVKDLKKQTEDLKKQNSELQGQVNGIQAVLGNNEPITATTTFKDDNNATRTIVDTYKFKASNYQTQQLTNNGDGTYNIYIERFSDVEWHEGAWVAFTYNPTTKAITNKRGGHYWGDGDEYYDNARYEGTATGLTLNITVEKLDVQTGDISMKFQATGTGDYTNSLDFWETPNQGKEMSTNFAFTGKLKLFTRG